MLAHLFHTFPTFLFQTRRTTRRSLAAARIAGDEDPPPRPVRRSQRARTPTRYFLSELSTRRRRSVTPKKEEKVEKHTTTTEDEEEKEEEEPFEVKRSEYELRSNFHATPRRSPRRQNSTHYFNSELPQHRQHHQPKEKKGWVAEDDEGSTYQLRSAKTKHSAAAAALFSDDESQGTDEKSVNTRISLYESKMRQRLKNFSNITKKKVSEGLGLSTQATTQSDEERAQSKPFQPTRSQQPKPPSIPSTHMYGTRSRSAQSRQTQTNQPPIPKMQLRSSKHQKEQVTSQPPPIITSSQGPLVPDHQPDGPPQDENPQEPPYPQWMQLGWEEVIITFIILGLILFAWYCFSSNGC